MKDKLYTSLIFFVALVLYSLTLHGVWGNPGPGEIKGILDYSGKIFELSPERGRYSHIYSLAENSTYELTQEWADVVHPDVGVYNGKYYAFFAPGISYLATPFYLIGKEFGLAQVFSYGVIALFSIGTLLCIYKISKNVFGLSEWVSMFSVFVFGFSSTAWGYALTLYQHHVTTFLLLFIFYGTWKFTQNKKGGVIWPTLIGLSYSFAIFIDYPNAILLLPVVLYFISTVFIVSKDKNSYFINIRWIGFFALLSFMILTSFQFYHNNKHYGSWKSLAGGISSYKIIKDESPVISEGGENTKLENKEKDVVGFFKEERVPKSFYTLFFSNDRGLFLFSPIFILSIFGIYQKRKRLTTQHYVLLWSILVNIFLYSSWGDPWGGWAFGPRYLIPSMASLSIFIAIFINEKSLSFLRRLTAFILASFSTGVALAGALTTNAVPTFTEGVLLPMGTYNYLFNFNFISRGISNSFLYNNYFSDKVTLLGYYIFIYGFLITLLLFILFFLPMISYKKQNE